MLIVILKGLKIPLYCVFLAYIFIHLFDNIFPISFCDNKEFKEKMRAGTSSGQGIFFLFVSAPRTAAQSEQGRKWDVTSLPVSWPAGLSWIHLTFGSHDHSFPGSHSKKVYKCRRTGRLPVEQEVGVRSAVFGRDDQVGKNKWIHGWEMEGAWPVDCQHQLGGPALILAVTFDLRLRVVSSGRKSR